MVLLSFCLVDLPLSLGDGEDVLVVVRSIELVDVGTGVFGYEGAVWVVSGELLAKGAFASGFGACKCDFFEQNRVFRFVLESEKSEVLITLT